MEEGSVIDDFKEKFNLRDREEILHTVTCQRKDGLINVTGILAITCYSIYWLSSASIFFPKGNKVRIDMANIIDILLPADNMLSLICHNKVFEFEFYHTSPSFIQLLSSIWKNVKKNNNYIDKKRSNSTPRALSHRSSSENSERSFNDSSDSGDKKSCSQIRSSRSCIPSTKERSLSDPEDMKIVEARFNSQATSPVKQLDPFIVIPRIGYESNLSKLVYGFNSKKKKFSVWCCNTRF